MKTIEIVVHCYAEKRPEFAKLLTAQLSSIALWPPKCRLRFLVIAWGGDATHCADLNTFTVADAFGADSDRQQPMPPNVTVRCYGAPKDLLFRRSILRNAYAKDSRADIVWFADSDYLFGEGCLDALAASDFKGLAYPAEVQIHRAHWLGDKEIARIKPGELFTPDLTLFETKREKYAIGGLQIVDGDTARKYGYLDGTKWVEPVPSATDFLDTKEDKHFRNYITERCGPSAALALPNLFRFRHSASAFEKPENRLKQTAHKT